MKVEAFPTLLYQYHIEKEDQAPIKARAEEFYSKNKLKKSVPNGWNCDLFTTHGSNNFSAEECINTFTPALSEFREESQSHGSVILETLWLNVYEKQNWQEKHIHPPFQWSGVYFVHFDPNEHNPTTFHHPSETLLATAGITTGTTFTPQVQEGDMIIFPSWLEHSVLMNKSSKIRSTISFNLFIEEEFYYES